jgi:serine/threonine-protein kinase
LTAATKLPAQLGKYRVVDVLGEGAMGVVYRAHDAAIDREVAVKTIRKELLSSTMATTLVERFRREAVAAGRLSHAGIVAVYDYGEDDESAFIVMELALGTSLDVYAHRRGSLSLDDVGALMAQLLDALGYAHERGIVHRDIKPSNVIVSDSGRVKITDFGIARIQSSTLTHTGVAVGTPSYMSPEQYMGTAVDHRADLFAAGVVLYELLTGARPFGGDTLESIAYQVCHSQHVPPSHRRPSLPARIDAVIATALAKLPEDRYATASALARGLATALAEQPANSPPDFGLAATLIGDAPIAGVRPPTAPLLNTDALKQVESALTPLLGPLAGVLVRRSAAMAATVDDLIDALTQNAANSADRARIAEATRGALSVSMATRFGNPTSGSAPPPQTPPTGYVAPPMSLAGPMPTSGPSTPGSNPGNASTPSSNPGTPSTPSAGVPTTIAQADIDGVTAELAKFVGPIARVLVKRALPRAGDLRVLCWLVAQGIEKEPDRAKFLRAMKVG